MRCSLARAGHGTVRPMRELVILAIHFLVRFAKLLRPGGVRAIAAESLLLKHQLLISRRSRQRAPNLTTLDRFVLGCSSARAGLGSLARSSSLQHCLKLRQASVDHKYRLLFLPRCVAANPVPKVLPINSWRPSSR